MIFNFGKSLPSVPILGLAATKCKQVKIRTEFFVVFLFTSVFWIFVRCAEKASLGGEG